MKLETIAGNHQSKLQLESKKFSCSSYSAAEGLKINEKRLFNSSSHSEKNEIMLSPFLLPNCVSKSFQIAKCLMSPCKSTDGSLPPIMASLTSHGSLELSKYHHNHDTNETTLESFVELCEIRKTFFSLGTYDKLGKLREILSELTFKNFTWCPEVVDVSRFIAAVTKSNEIVFCSIDVNNEVAVQHNEKLEDVVSNLKWVISGGHHFLYVADVRGDLTRFSIEINKEMKLTAEKLEGIKGKLNMPVSNIWSESLNDAVLLVCAKAHSLEVFLIAKSGVKTLTKYVGLNVTGIANIMRDKPEFLISTLNSKIFFLKISTAGDDLKVEEFQKVELPETKMLKFATYGIAASQNKVLIFLAMYPQTVKLSIHRRDFQILKFLQFQMFDHLTLKQPVTLSVHLLPSKNDPHKILINNQSRRLTEFYDCVEAVRFVGSSRIDTLKVLDDVDYDIALDDKFLYYLKLQLIVVTSKLVFYQTRSDTMFDMLREFEASIKKIIEVIKAFLLLKSLAARKKLTNQSQLSMRRLTNFLKMYTNEEIVKEPFKTAQLTFKPNLLALLDKSGSASLAKSETCFFCQEIIHSEKLTCESNHQSNLCVITKLQIPFSMNNTCPTCNCCVMDLTTLKDVTGNSEQFCPFCDRHFSFN